MPKDEEKMQKLKAVIFDLDGTLLDTLADLTVSTNYALRKNGQPERTAQEIQYFVGNGAHKLIERAVPGKTVAEVMEQVLRDFDMHYKIHCKDQTAPYPGIPEMLAALREQRYRLGVVSNKPDFAVQELIPEYFPETFFSVTGERQGMAKKPAPDLLLDSLRRLRADRTEAVYVGDSEVDLEAAKNAGLPCIAVAWGFKGRAFLESLEAAYIADRPEDILTFLRRFSRK